MVYIPPINMVKLGMVYDCFNDIVFLCHKAPGDDMFTVYIGTYPADGSETMG